MEIVKDLDSKNFDEFVKEGLVVLDFWAAWCAPCRIMSPIFEETAKEFKKQVKFGKINVDDEQELAQRFQIMSIPTMVVYKNGKVVGRSVGVMSKEMLERKIKNFL